MSSLSIDDVIEQARLTWPRDFSSSARSMVTFMEPCRLWKTQWGTESDAAQAFSQASTLQEPRFSLRFTASCAKKKGPPEGGPVRRG